MAALILTLRLYNLLIDFNLLFFVFFLLTLRLTLSCY